MTRRSHRKLDPDVKALCGAARALRYSSSPRMLRVNLQFLWDSFVLHPSVATRAFFETKTPKEPR